MTMFAGLSTIPTCIIPAACELGEGPRWHAGERRLYWVDIAAYALHRWDAESGEVESRRFNAPVACFAFRRSGGLILGMKDGCAAIGDWDATPTPFGDQMLADKPNHRLNDGRTDPAGRFWVGSVNSAKDAQDAALYCIEADGTTRLIEGGMTTCNGAAFSTDGTVFAHADTPSHAVRAYDCDPMRGVLSARHILHQFEHGVGVGLGRPDGGSFDVEGCYWTALFDGGRVVRLSPDGDVIANIALPVSRPTMIAFGGDDGCTAFVTSAWTGLSAAERIAQPDAGGIFAFRVAVPGVREFAFGD